MVPGSAELKLMFSSAPDSLTIFSDVSLLPFVQHLPLPCLSAPNAGLALMNSFSLSVPVIRISESLLSL